MRRMSTTGIAALRAAKDILGTEAAMAAVVGCSQPYVHSLLARGKRVPAEWCIPLADATAAKGQPIPRAAFRPDLYPGESVSHVASSAPSRAAGKRPKAKRPADQSNPNPAAVAS